MSEAVPRPRAGHPVHYGRVAYPGIGYRIGERQMITTVMSPVTFVGTVGPREVWDPLSGSGTNRKEDKAHRAAIAQYLEETPDYVLNSILVYISTDDAHFVPDNPDDPISPGTLYVRPGAKFIVGDGGHRTSAFGDVINAHEQIGDDIFQRLMTNGQPIIVVLDDDQARRAQDFTDLQRNAKPLNASIAQSMDRRQAINRLLIDDLIKGKADIPIIDGGRRIEFLSDTPGKLSAKLMGFKTLRYASGTLLVGAGIRSVSTWDEAVSIAIAKDHDAALDALIAFWTGLSELPDMAQALHTEKGMMLLRERTWLGSANVLYAIAAAVHKITHDSDTEIASAVAALADFDFTRTGTTLHGTLVDPETGKAASGREAWEGAATVMARHIEHRLSSVSMP